VLVVDDDAGIRELLRSTLLFAGYQVIEAGDATTALRALRDHRPQAVLLDVGLPDTDGLDVVRFLRAQGDTTPVLFLTARDAPDERVAGFSSGGDDYVTKPFTIAEVTARLAAVLRRAAARDDRGDPGDRGRDDDVLRHADLVLDVARKRVSRAGVLLDLSPTEFRLLEYLLENAGRVVSKAQILDRVWHYDFGGDSGVVEKFVSTLRRKVDPVGSTPLITTVRGFGYCVRGPEST
jgi:two-component system OmpR family response regulator